MARERGDGDGGGRGGKSGRIISWIRRTAANPATRFVFFFVIILGIQSLVYPVMKAEFPGMVKGMILGTAHIEFWILDLFSDDASVSGRVVSYGGFPVKIIEECTGLYEVIIFSSAVLAYPTSWKNKGLGLLVGTPLIYFFNILRILVLIIVGNFYHRSFEFMHLYFWQATMIAMITGVWLLWIVKVVRRETTALHPRP